MESNIADKIKLFENTNIQYTAPLEVDPADSSRKKEEIIKLAPPSLSRPRRKKKLTQTKQVEQAEYVNVGSAAEAQWSPAPLSVSSSDYPQACTNLRPFNLKQSTEYANFPSLGASDTEHLSKPRRKKKLTQTKQVEYVNVSPVAEAQWYQASVSSSDYPQAYTNPHPFNLEKSAEYANLLPLGTSDTERLYVDPEGKYVTIKKEHTKKPTKKLTAKKTPIEAIQAVQLDVEQSEYANLLPLGTSDTERFYVDPEGKYVTIKKEHTKKRTKKLAAEETPIAGGIHYAELDLTQSDQVNVLQGKKPDDTTTEYSYLGVDNRLILSSKADQDKVLSIANNEQKTRFLGVEGLAAVGAKNKIQRQRKKNKSKDNYLRPLTAKFEKLKIQPIQEESTSTSSMEMDEKGSMLRQHAFKFFAKKPKDLTQETKKSASNFSFM